MERDELAVAGVDAGDVAEDFGDAHDGDVFGADGLLLAFGAHFGAAEAGEGGGGEAASEFGDELRAVVVAGGFAGGEEDARVGLGGDDVQFTSESEGLPPLPPPRGYFGWKCFGLLSLQA